MNNKNNKPINIIVTGLRGIPNVQGGIETHVRMLQPLVARLGCDIEVVQRGPYFPHQARKDNYHSVRLTYLWSPTKQVVETAVHTLFAVFYAAFSRPDVLHIHGIGPGFLTPLARLFGLRVVITHHTFDYRREKWSKFSKAVFRVGEQLGMKCANQVIVVSKDIQRHVREAYGVNATLIPNGARIPVLTPTTKTLEEFGLTPSKYVICVARFESTKRHHDLIEAFEQASTENWKLVLVGGLDAPDRYTREIMERVQGNDDIILTGFQSGRALRELYSHAGLFVLSSSHEGLPIALLEALSYGIPSIATNIPANATMPLPSGRYFPVGAVDDLARLIEVDIAGRSPRVNWRRVREEIRFQFDWKMAARLTYAVYRRALPRPPLGHPERAGQSGEYPIPQINKRVQPTNRFYVKHDTIAEMTDSDRF